MKYWFCFVVFLCTVTLLYAQPPIGQWQEHLPYNAGLSVATVGNNIYCATEQALIYVDATDNSIHKLSKVNGLSETGISTLKKNDVTQTLIVAYTNGNIDFIKNKKIINCNDIQRKNILGDKTIYNVYSKNNINYCCTGFGIVAIDEVRNETKDTYYIGTNGSYIKVSGLTDDGIFFYAATTEGLKKAPLTSNALNNYTTWQTITGNGLSTGAVKDVVFFGGKILALKNDSIFVFNNNVWTNFYTTTNKITSIRITADKLVVMEQVTPGKGRVVQLEANGTIATLISTATLPEVPKDCIKLGTTYWIADYFKGLYKVENNNFTTYTPNAPQSTASGDMIVKNDVLYAAAGNVNDAWNYTFNPNGLLKYESNFWSPIWRFSIPAMDTMLDFISLTATNDALYAGSYGGGLQQINNTGTVKLYKQNSGLEAAIGDPNNYRVSGLATDADNNIWVSNFGTANQLKVLLNNGNWQRFAAPYSLTDNAVAQILIDDANQKWIVSPKSNGLICYNHGTSITALNDDKWRLYKAGAGNGNLPSNDVNCLAKDKDGILWVGTNKGIALVQCVSDVFTTNGCEAVLPIVQQDQFAGYLFQNEVVQSIAVDGANRKWVGTKNGVWLISTSGDKIIYRFSDANSPLLSNDIKRIAIHPKTGEVFFATSKGICSFRSTATEATTNDSKVLIFPNPVPSNFNGLIGIRNLPNNSIVKITALDGRLIYQTKALGGQAVWNGQNYKGEKINSGAYLVLATNEDNNEKVVGKLFFIAK